MNQLSLVVVCGLEYSEWKKFSVDIKALEAEYYSCFGFPLEGSYVRIHFQKEEKPYYIEGEFVAKEASSMAGTRVLIQGDIYDEKGNVVTLGLHESLSTSIGSVFKAS